MINWQNPDDATLTELLKDTRTIAVYGCSPKAETILGQKVCPRLADIPLHVDIVNVFRRAEFTPDVARQAVEISAGALWLQQGIINEESYRIAKDSGLIPIMDLCIAVMHRLLIR